MITETEIPNKSEPSNSGAAMPPQHRSPRLISTLVIIGLGVLSFAIGFLLVHFVVPRGGSDVAPEPCAAPQTARMVADAAASPDDAGPADAGEGADLTDTGEQMPGNASAGLPEVPPGATPDGVRLDGVPLYFKCWVKATDSGSSKECDRLRVLEKRMATRLYVVDECRQKYAEGEKGLLSLGANLNFADNSISFWSGPSSTIASASKIGNCVRSQLAGLPLSSISHKHEKYRLFFTVDFFDPEQRAQLLARKRKNGREVEVTMDKVNVREEPVDGSSMGRISTGSKVILLKKNDTKDWCQVLTPNNREGWMICEALKL
jgi:hypothetical protein